MGQLMDEIHDMHNYIQSRKRKGKTANQVRSDLENRGYDHHAARGLVMLHWIEDEELDEEATDEDFIDFVSEKIGGGLE